MTSSSSICIHTKMGSFTNAGAPLLGLSAPSTGKSPRSLPPLAHIHELSMSLRWDVTAFYVLRPKERGDCTSPVPAVSVEGACPTLKVYRSCPFALRLWGADYGRTKMSYPSLIMRIETMMRKKTLTNLFPFKIARRVPTREPSILQRAIKIAAL